MALVKFPSAFRPRKLAQSVCLRSGLILGAGISPVNFCIKLLLWNLQMHFDCAGSHKVCVCVCVLGTWGWPWISGAELLHLSWHLLWSRCTSVRGGKNCPIWQFRSSSWQHKYVTTCVSPYMPYVIVCATLHTYQLMLLQNMSYLPCRQNHLIVQEKILGWQGSWSSERMWAWMPDIDCQSNISGRGSLEIILVEIIQKNTAGFLSPKCCRYSHTYPLFLHKPMLEARKDWPMIDLADTLSVEHTSSG